MKGPGDDPVDVHSDSDEEDDPLFSGLGAVPPEVIAKHYDKTRH